ncbi:MAG: AbrB/MazE/SpoVT family DNA-binding domain-containing protein [Anaerolineae bacterium]|jgi:antitoxin component of MazEF toxin-antitoxin module|nr:AbrB/MazE/SpoVT family DNA-binding domain-containing protein [Anaerolineae bacterium]MBT4456860.1 AbrB/MazE/SpoVT family DNA-binding domain-containing protein [Anaerolineae bacterium]MBT6059847.1 AbrB/MazE/SpoVT family DNA-binding domain-containing protein [Anaerolineae bacterium]MBT7602601.1 AbrB/MazE/SpoVT family DNA-binding domain-containing protein [Anaerolineae bacterium]
MSRKIFKAGNSAVVSLPKDMLEALQIRDGSQVDVILDQPNRQIIIRPTEHLSIVGIDTDFAHQVSEFIAMYRPVLEELAK